MVQTGSRFTASLQTCGHCQPAKQTKAGKPAPPLKGSCQHKGQCCGTKYFAMQPSIYCAPLQIKRARSPVIPMRMRMDEEMPVNDVQKATQAARRAATKISTEVKSLHTRALHSILSRHKRSQVSMMDLT